MICYFVRGRCTPLAERTSRKTKAIIIRALFSPMKAPTVSELSSARSVLGSEFVDGTLVIPASDRPPPCLLRRTIPRSQAGSQITPLHILISVLLTKPRTR